ncbi:MAG: hypothetical protein ABIV63_12765 [Caldimonas sp.]
MPFAVASNKVFLARGRASADAYRQGLLLVYPYAKLTEFFGSVVMGFDAPSLQHRVSAYPHWLRLRETPVNRAFRKSLKRLNALS